MELTVRVEKPLYGGSGLGFADGKALFVRHGIPGELLRVRITEQRADYSLADIVDVLEPSNDRIEPVCERFGHCGGCDYLHVDYAEELRIKKSVLRDCLTRIGGFLPSEIPEIGLQHGERFRYRSHCSVKSDGMKTGLFRENTNSVVPFPDEGCLLFHNAICELISGKKLPRGETRIAIDSKGEPHSSLETNAILEEKVGGFMFSRGIDDFFQSNLFLREKLMTQVMDLSGQSGGEFIDIACGVGFFTLPLGKIHETGTGFDISRGSIGMARRNARVNGLNNITFTAVSASQITPGISVPDLLVIDPPRGGIDKKARRTIQSIGAPTMIYISCNPATFARDAKNFVKGGYRLESLVMIDMFPCTSHIETVSRFVLN